MRNLQSIFQIINVLPLWEKIAIPICTLLISAIAVRVFYYLRNAYRSARIRQHYKDTGNDYEFEPTAIETEVIVNLVDLRLGQEANITDSEFGQLAPIPGSTLVVAPAIDFLSAGKVAVDAFDALAKGTQFLKDLWKKLAGKPLLVVENRCDEAPWRLGIIKDKWAPANIILFVLKIDGKSRHMSINYTDKAKNVTSALKIDLQKVSPDLNNPTIHKLGINLTEELLNFVRKQMTYAKSMHSMTSIRPNEIVHTIFKLSEVGHYIFYYHTDDSKKYYRCYHVNVRPHKDYSIIIEQKVDDVPSMSTVNMSDRVIA